MSWKKRWLIAALKKFKVGDRVRIIKIPGIMRTPISIIQSIDENGLVSIYDEKTKFWSSVSIHYIEKVNDGT